MSQSIATQVMIVKADIDGDMRRVSVDIPEDAPAAEMLRIIRFSVAQGFAMDEAVLPSLKYRDDDGDLCTLVAASMNDMLELNNKGVLRLFASKTSSAVLGSAGYTRQSEDVAPASLAAPVPPPCQVDAEVPCEAQVACSEREPVVAKEAVEGEIVAEAVEVEHLASTMQIRGAEKALFRALKIKAEELSEEALKNASDDVAMAPAEDTAIGAPQCYLEKKAEDDASGSCTVDATDIAAELDTKVDEPQAFVHVVEVQEEEEEDEPQEEPTEKAEDTDGLATLMAMGFPREEAIDALQRSRGNVESALEHLIHGEQNEGQPTTAFPPPHYQDMKSATTLDHAQVFVSQSISAFRSQASKLVKGKRPDKWVNIPASTFSAGPVASSASASCAHPEDSLNFPASTSNDSTVDGFLLTTALQPHSLLTTALQPTAEFDSLRGSDDSKESTGR